MGYTKVTLGAGYSIVGAQFINVGGSTLAVSKVDGNFQTDDQIRFWDATAEQYDTYAFYGEDADGGVYTDSSYEECLGAGWGDDSQIAVDKNIGAGTGFWLKIDNGAVVTVSGQVSENTTVSFSAGYNLLANPRPVSVPLSQVASSSLATDDQIRFWDSDTEQYTTYAFYGEDADGGVYTDSSYEECLGAGWGDDGQIVVNKAIGVGEGFWLKAASSGTLSFGEN